MGHHRDSFYEIKRAFQTSGVAALVTQRRGPRGPHPNRISPEVEQAILDFCVAYPTKGLTTATNGPVSRNCSNLHMPGLP